MIFDLFILGGFVLSGWLGYRNGILKKILGLVSFFVGLIVATKCMGPCGRLLVSWFGFSLELAYVFAFFAVFLLIILLENVLYRLIVKKKSPLDLINRIGGVLFGLVQGSVGISLFLLMLSIFEIPGERTKKESYLYKPILNVAPRLFDFALAAIPQSKTFYNTLKNNLQKYEIFN